MNADEPVAAGQPAGEPAGKKPGAAETAPQDQPGAESTPAKQDAASEKPPSLLKRVPWWGWLIAATLLIVLGVVYWLIFVRGYESTDDAYTDGNAVPIAAKVSGYVRTLAIRDNQAVKAGDLLLAIEPADYQASLENAEASVGQVRAQLESARLDLAVQRISQHSTLESARASVGQAEANLKKAEDDLRRQLGVDPLATTQQQTDQIRAAATIQIMSLRSARAQLKTAEEAPRNVAIAQAKVAQLEAQLKGATAQLDQARLNLGYTELRAPIDGHVTDRNVEIGTYVQPGATLLDIVGDDVWVTANFKEDQLQHMRAQQPVDITIDAYPDLDLHGHVDSIQFGSGSRFSAFPAENATGNFVKIVRRVPVKIVIDRGLDPQRPLPLGLSVLPTVDER